MKSTGPVGHAIDQILSPNFLSIHDEVDTFMWCSFFKSSNVFLVLCQVCRCSSPCLQLDSNKLAFVIVFLSLALHHQRDYRLQRMFGFIQRLRGSFLKQKGRHLFSFFSGLLCIEPFSVCSLSLFFVCVPERMERNFPI